ncbi:hypothetical protein RBSWK_00765 [Rhodopirellula baltica SWK14]|uniref:Uncharacterized protein n=1 Tax=Rhodopirellula baltica SWK14 TaxID=993516 RepID=L7CN54_RHOBT|nr:hypothetical protein RBSWK_00765 [Rhodopirellula baltica SWK14]
MLGIRSRYQIIALCILGLSTLIVSNFNAPFRRRDENMRVMVVTAYDEFSSNSHGTH